MHQVFFATNKPIKGYNILTKYVVTVMAIDRVGIIRDVSRALSNSGGNITNVSQTVMRGYFTLIISVQMPDDTPQLAIRQAVERSGDVGEFEVNVRPFIETHTQTDTECERYMLSVTGDDKSGIIAKTADVMAEHGTNIDDLYAYVTHDRFLMLAHVSVPLDTDVESVQTSLEEMGREMGFLVHFQHENIFRATSDIAPVNQLGSSKRMVTR